jgi:Uma2 family endonuclease
MGMPQTSRRWTREEVLALPDDGNRYELLDGELMVSPSPKAIHQRAVWILNQRLYPYVNQHQLGEVGLAPSDLDFRSGQSLQPDLFVIEPSLPAPGRGPDWSDYGIPFLVIEVLSPSTAFNDRNKKRLKFQRVGVAEYWIVDTHARLIERWRPEDERPEILAERIEWQPRPDRPPLVIDLEEYFREVWRE